MGNEAPVGVLSFLILCFVWGTLGNNQTPCFEYLCFCNGSVANCSNNGKFLQFLPRVNWPKDILKYYFDNNYLPTVTKTTFKHIVNYNITWLSLKGNNITTISKTAFFNLKHLQRLHLSFNIIEPKVLKLALTNTKSLFRLYLESMNISSLPDDIFDGLKHGKIERIHLGNNRLTHFNQTVISELKYLTTFDLSSNQISSLVLKHSDILATLLLTSNRLQVIPNFCPNGSALYPRLWTLALEDNNISNLTIANFRCLTFLRKLLLSDNRFSRIPANAFLELRNLEKLFFSQNKEKQLSIDTYAFNGSHFSYLNLSSSSVYFDHHTAFENCSYLRILDLSNTNLHEYDFFLQRLIQKMKLYSILCNNCRLQAVPPALKNMEDLREVYLDYNSIAHIPDHIFDSNVNLRNLSFRQNNITTLTGFDISYSVRYKLKYISFEDNPFSCDCRLLWLKNWIDSNKTLFSGQFMNYKCASPSEVKGLQLLDVGIVSDKRCLIISPFTYVMCLVGTALFCLVIIALVYKCRYSICFCFVKRRPKYTEESRPLLQNDAYVVYCDENYHPWIRSQLMPNMEEHRSLRLGIRQRDFDQSRHKVSNIVENLKCCRKVLVVLSNSFFKDSESQDELSLVLRCIEDQRGVLVVILLEDIDDRYMSRALGRMLHITTKLQWPTEPRTQISFWDHLKESLEDSAMYNFS